MIVILEENNKIPIHEKENNKIPIHEKENNSDT